MSQCACVNGSCKRYEGDLPFEFTKMFQPIVDLSLARVVTYEALARAGIIRQQGYDFAIPAINSLGGDIPPLLAGLKDEVYKEKDRRSE